ncbi:nitrate/nitrite two-component system sensor histidine kinase NarQ [Testudinibacter sp. TR-2022]|uniref:nitrate/nitrite two-component system sensor histidine kinase NarQ n=1 Tax=Testudinibacter sp. TR-2022 TaxID=2585029 RepID=UPI0011189E72|nr:nitrate/nitrite two-component system sensor histidine kinase NarQ [Testudinibacter sp. TR-2022]TNH04597.1 nitrate/nitrite two-component system sensor histidine kinase NarQ [Pasteurellaceae bacterium Phil31]TNH09389.1 nitrate/nitrite two-component system sensor histidine kinase NarQ [Testudinibacter sp. TR-2022]TNH09824.1 nitrate/nitrite two-component system sensor histidine kinase NarQ [Testudinibacter sp. TR-2022]
MQIKKSVTSRLAYNLVLIILLSGLSTCVTTLIMISNHSDAEMINVSGSLRMQSYRLLHEMQYQPELLEHGVKTYRASLQTPTLMSLERFYVPSKVQSAYRTLLESWAVMEQYILQHEPELYRQNLERYVEQVDNFVSVLQVFSEQRIRFAIYINIFSLLLMILLSAYLLSYSRKKVVEPLQRLVTASRQVQNSQFQHINLDIDSANELGELSRGFTQMAAQLQKLYLSLEEQVSQKTRSLTQINRTLSMLYYSSQQLTLHEITRENLLTVLTLLQQNEKLQVVRLSANGNEMFDLQAGQESDVPWQTIRIMINEQHLGNLNWQRSEAYPDLRTIENIAQMLGRAIHSYQLLRQRQHLILMQERSIIARELHDSLAQVLAYLQIQLTLLKRSIIQEVDAAKANKSLTILNQFETALSDGYTQLRELLATFRLTVSESNLTLALQEVIDSLQSRSEAKIVLDCALPSQLLNAQQQIHLLQIVREAVLNSIKHASASLIEVVAKTNPDGENEVLIRDDGIGIPSLNEPSGHYGLNIMHERAQELKAILNIQRRATGGTEVSLRLPNSVE